eukprot:9723114-Karenia_brevis.AAC.1
MDCDFRLCPVPTGCLGPSHLQVQFRILLFPDFSMDVHPDFRLGSGPSLGLFVPKCNSGAFVVISFMDATLGWASGSQTVLSPGIP